MDSPPADFPTLQFADGVVARMTDIHIRHTYADYLEARPCPAINADVMKRLREKLGNGRKPVLVVPPDKSMTDLTGGAPYQYRPLPRFEMVADFQSSATTDATQDFSFLTVAWHQDVLSPWIDDETRDRISKITWFPRASHGSC